MLSGIAAEQLQEVYRAIQTLDPREEDSREELSRQLKELISLNQRVIRILMREGGLRV